MTPEEFKEMRQILWQFVPIENYGEALAELEKIARRTVSGQEAGWKLVPIEPTQAMIYAAVDTGCCTRPTDAYAAMLDAAPIPATEQKDAEQ